MHGMLTRKTLVFLFLVFCRLGGSVFASSVESTSAKMQKARQRGKKMQTRRGPKKSKRAKTKSNKRGWKTAKKAASPFWTTTAPQASLPGSADVLGTTDFPLVATKTSIDGDLVPEICQRETNFGRVMGQAMLKAVPSADIALTSCGDFQANILGPIITRADVRRGLRDKKHLLVLKFTASELLAHLEKALSQKPGIASWEDHFFKQVGGVFLRFTTERPGLKELTEVLTPSRITFLQVRNVTVVKDSRLAIPPNEEFVVVTTTSFLGANEAGNGTSTAPMPGTLLINTNMSTQDALEQHIIDVGVLNVSDPPENVAISREIVLPQPPAQCAAYKRGYTNIFLDDEECFDDFIGPHVVTTCEDFTNASSGWEFCGSNISSTHACVFQSLMPGFRISAPFAELFVAGAVGAISGNGTDGYRFMDVDFTTRRTVTIASLRFWCGFSANCTGARIVAYDRGYNALAGVDLSHIAAPSAIELLGRDPSLLLAALHLATD